jgi:hypothetical protein
MLSDKIFYRAMRQRLSALAQDRAKIITAGMPEDEAKLIHDAAVRVGSEFPDQGLAQLLARVASVAADQILRGE